jgi:hypothetical protein
LTTAGGQTITGTDTFGGVTVTSSFAAASGSFTLNSPIIGETSPYFNGNYDLGNVTHGWRTLYLQNALYITTGVAPASIVIDSNRDGTFRNISATAQVSAQTGSYNQISFNSLEGSVGSGNFYLRNFVGTPSCSGVGDGWVGYDRGSDKIIICSGGVARLH